MAISPASAKELGKSKALNFTKLEKALLNVVGILVLICIILGMLLAQNYGIRKKYEVLQKDYEKLTNAYNALKRKSTEWENKYNDLLKRQSNKSGGKNDSDKNGLQQNVIRRPDWEEMPLPFDDGILVKATTNKNGRVVERYQTPDGKMHVVVRPKRRLFYHISDNLIAAVVSNPTDISLPPLPNVHITKAQFLESLETPIAIEPGDSEQDKELKNKVANVRLQIFKMMEEEDGDFNDILDAHREAWNNNVDLRRDVIKATREFIVEGDMENAEKFLERANKQLEASGLDPVDVDTINRGGVKKIDLQKRRYL